MDDDAAVRLWFQALIGDQRILGGDGGDAGREAHRDLDRCSTPRLDRAGEHRGLVELRVVVGGVGEDLDAVDAHHLEGADGPAIAVEGEEVEVVVGEALAQRIEGPGLGGGVVEAFIEDAQLLALAQGLVDEAVDGAGRGDARWGQRDGGGGGCSRVEAGEQGVELLDRGGALERAEQAAGELQREHLEGGQDQGRELGGAQHPSLLAIDGRLLEAHAAAREEVEVAVEGHPPALHAIEEVGRGEPAFGVLEELEELPSAAKL